MVLKIIEFLECSNLGSPYAQASLKDEEFQVEINMCARAKKTLCLFAFLALISWAGGVFGLTLSVSPVSSANGSFTVSLDYPLGCYTEPSSGANVCNTLQKSTGGSYANQSTSHYTLSGNSSAVYSGQASGTYTFRVYQVISMTYPFPWSDSGYTNTTTVTVSLVPGTPSLSSPSGTNYSGSYSISWGSVANATSYQLQEKLNSGSWSTIHNAGGTSKSRSGRTPGTWYYRVKACGAGGCSGWSSTKSVSVSTPSAPSTPNTNENNPSTSKSYDGGYSVTWGAKTGASSYQLQEKFNSDSWSTIHNASGTSKSRSGKGSGTWYYRVKACSGSGCSGWSSTKTMTVIRTPSTPATPSGPGTDYTGSYSIGWSAVSGATAYQLQEKLNSGSWGTVHNASAVSKSVSGKTPGSWYYRLRACNESGANCSGWSSTKTVAVAAPSAPGTPTGPTSINYTGSYTISWSGVSNASSYQLQEQLNSGSWSSVYDSSGTSSSRSGLTAGAWNYRVRSCSGSGCSGWSGTKSVVVSDPVVPNTPTGPNTNYTGTYTISWSSVVGSPSYEVQEQLNGGSWSTIQNSASTSVNRSSLANGAWNYRVRACTSGCSGWSGTKTAAVIHTPSVPSTPTGPTSTSYSGSYTISWNSVSGATAYQLQENQNGGTWSTVHDASGTSKSRTDRSADNWNYRVRACNDSGNNCSGWSGTKTVQTHAPIGIPATPTGPETNSTGSFTINWTTFDNASSYQLQERLGSGSWATVHSAAGTSTGRSGLSVGTWSYRVRACSGAGCASDSWSGVKAVVVNEVISAPPGSTSNDPIISAQSDGGVGRTSGRFNVSRAGSANYSIPIQVPAGINGIEPKLAFNYSSKAGNGQMGIGWDVGGLSKIYRCSKTKAFDDESAPPSLEGDSFCLDGMKLASQSGTAGITGTVYDTLIQNYQRIEALGTAGQPLDSFRVEGKNDGLIYEYGTTIDSKIVVPIPGATSGVAANVWLLAKIRDRNDNEMSITYENEGLPNGGYRPLEINYTSNDSLGIPASYKVKFVWENRQNANDWITHKANGSFVKQTKLLDRVEVQYRDPALGGSYRVVKNYELTYGLSDASARSRLRRIKECVGTNVNDNINAPENNVDECLRPTEIAWGVETSGWSNTLIDTGANSTHMQWSHAVDMDADGRVDLVYPSGSQWNIVKSNGTGGFDSAQYLGASSSLTSAHHAIPLLVNSYGAIGLLPGKDVGAGNSNVKSIYAWKNSETEVINTIMDGAIDGANWMADFTGNGAMDFAYLEKVGSTYQVRVEEADSYEVHFSSPQTFYTATFPVTDATVYNSWKENRNNYLADFNGDGKADIVLAANYSAGDDPYQEYSDVDSWRVLLSDGVQFNQNVAFQVATSYVPADVIDTTVVYALTHTEPLVGDFDADGFTDLMVFSGSTYLHANGQTNNVVPKLYFGSSSGLVDSGVTNLPSYMKYCFMATSHAVNGRSDLFCRTSDTATTTTILSWNGSAFSAQTTNIPATSNAIKSMRAADFNGDGLLDIGYYDGSSYKVRLHNGVNPDHIASITGGFGESIQITYATMEDASVFTVGQSYVDPYNSETVAPYHPAGHLVKQVTRSDGIGGTYSGTYEYSDARHDEFLGLGRKGFAQRKETDSRTGVATTWDYHTEYPYIGKVTKRSVAQSGGALISEVTNTYGQVLDPESGLSGHHGDFTFPYVQQSVVKKYEVGGALNGQLLSETVTTVEDMGDFGIPLSVRTEITDKQPGSLWVNETFTTVTQNPVSDIVSYTGAGYYCVGIPQRKVVTTTLPNGLSESRTTEITGFDTAMCRVTETAVEPDSATLRVTTNLGYDNCGNINSVSVVGKKPDGSNMPARTTTSNYGANCQFPESVTNTLSKTSNFTYRYDLGLLASQTDPNDETVSWQYDDFGRKVREGRPDNTSTTWTFEFCDSSDNYCNSYDAGVLVQIATQERDNIGGVIRQDVSQLDSRDRIRHSASQLPSGYWSFTATSYNNRGQVFEKTSPYTGSVASKQRFIYDLAGRAIRQELINSGGGVDRFSSTSYTGRSITATDPLTNAGLHSSVTTKVFDVVGNLRQVIDPSAVGGGITTYTYTPSGNLKTMTDAAGNTTTLGYNALGLKTSSSDPDMGNWIYSYNSLGELLSQTDAKNQTVSYTYDGLGRSLSRTEPEGTTSWTWGDSAANNNIGQLLSVSSPGGYSESYTYDSIGRPNTVSYNLDTSYTVGFNYNNQGLLDTLTYPETTGASPLKVQHSYSHGMLTQVSDFDTNTPYWTLDETDSRGRVIEETLGNNVQQLTGYDSLTGLIRARQSGNGGSSANLQDLEYEWDKNGNLTYRLDHLQNGLTESFTYDELDRLTETRINGILDIELDVDSSIGNINSKTGVGIYDYTTPQTGCSYYAHTQPHAVRNAGGISYCYDPNGNMTQRGIDTITWTSYNKPKKIDQGSNSSEFFYGADRNRWKQIATNSGSAVETTYYVGGLLEAFTSGGITQYRHMIAGGSDVSIIHTRYSNSSNTNTYYATSDHLGSASAITDQSGALIVKQSFDAFGKRRDVDWDGPPISVDLSTILNVSPPGYTGHEMLDNVGLIHMNGRVYDPNLARFASADPFVQVPDHSQSLNRFSYVWNNPLRYTDPTGYDLCDPDDIHYTVPCEEIFTYPGGSTGGDGWDINWSQSGSAIFSSINLGRMARLIREQQDLGHYEDAIALTQTFIDANNLILTGGETTEVGVRSRVANAQLTMIATLLTRGMWFRQQMRSDLNSQMATKGPAQRLADKVQGLPSSQRPNTVAVIKHKDGTITVGRNQGGVQNSTVQNALDKAPSNCFAGQCAEINALSRALNKGRSLDGATISVSNVRGASSTSGIHGTPKAPCTTCSSVLDQLGVKH